jgi:hypothetical protein
MKSNQYQEDLSLDTNRFEIAALFEHRFWLQVLGDHSRFIFNTLSPKEAEYVRMAQYFIDAFDELLEQAREDLTAKALVDLTSLAKELAEDIRTFKLHIIGAHLQGKVAIELPPTFLNHMVNEVEEYIRILCHLTDGEIPPLIHPVHHHLIWLLDAAGHASSLSSSLDPVEKQLASMSEGFTKHFEQFYIKAVEISGYLRTQLDQFPALSRFNNQVELEILLFKEFLRELEELEMTDQVLGTLNPLLLDHMAREECYYLSKLAQVSEVKYPDCNPTKPRNE